MSKIKQTPENSHEIMANFSKIPNELIRSPLLTPTEKTICSVLLSYNPSFPSYGRIMKDSNVRSRATIAKSLKSLEKFNFIKVIGSSKYRSNLYKFIHHDFRKDIDLNELNSDSSTCEPELVQEVNSNKTNINILTNNIQGPEAPPKEPQEPINETKNSSTDFSIITSTRKSLDCKPNYFRKSEEKPSFIVEGL